MSEEMQKPKRRNEKMLELINIKKDYPAGDGTVHALKGISLQFRRNEFVSILVHRILIN